MIKFHRVVVLGAFLLGMSFASGLYAGDFDGAPGVSAIERGEYLLRAGGCRTCHTDRAGGGTPLAGGRALESPYGVFYSPNITPDPKFGIGTWSDEDFIEAMRHGRSPEGRTYYPAFPYTAYTRLSDRDILDIKAYLFSVAPVAAENKEQDLRFPFSWRFSLYPWRLFFFNDGPMVPDTALPSTVARGAYLVNALGHCAECHTPRNLVGGLKAARPLAGTRYGPGGAVVPNITPDSETGIGEWSVADLVYFFRTGLKPDGDDVTGEMREAIDDGLQHLSNEDLAAIAAYLLQLEPIHNPVRRKAKSAPAQSYDEW
jgi:mono/diheme cytochrome c family protein